MKLVSVLVCGAMLSVSLVSLFSGSVHAAQEPNSGKISEYVCEQQKANAQATGYRQALMESRDEARQKLEDRMALFKKERNWIMTWFACHGKELVERDMLVDELEEAYWREMEALMRDCLLWRSSQCQSKQDLASRL